MNIYSDVITISAVLTATPYVTPSNLIDCLACIKVTIV
jgi:hypothetical protein